MWVEEWMPRQAFPHPQRGRFTVLVVPAAAAGTKIRNMRVRAVTISITCIWGPVGPLGEGGSNAVVCGTDLLGLAEMGEG